MIHSHFAALVASALIVAVVFGIITKNTPHDQVRYALFVFVSFLAAALVLGWLMFPFPF